MRTQAMRANSVSALLVGLPLIFASAPVRAFDPCGDLSHAVASLRQGDEFQATTLLFRAARLGCEKEAEALLDRGASIKGRDREGATALARAAQAGKLKILTLLLDRGADVNARLIDGSTALFLAAEA
ncbi:MAG: ankyrin repeat domain-containing protein, partial [Hyphomicrobiales bacterium]|nr:ankyrin repeat domain-containing protein [Hyphomicrobiales bacterium]